MFEGPEHRLPRTVGRFDACGRERSSGEEMQASNRAAYDRWLADRCEQQGITAYRRPGNIVAVDLLSEGRVTAPLAPVYCNRRFFQTVAAAENAQHLRLAELFFDPQSGPGSLKPVHEIILRPKLRKPLVVTYHCEHMAFVTEVGLAIKHLQRRGLIETLFVARHPRPCANGWVIDDHCHVLMHLDRQRLDEIRDYLAERFLMDAKSVSRVDHPVSRIAYLIAPRQWRLDGDLCPDHEVAPFRTGCAGPGAAQEDVAPDLPLNAARTGLDDKAFAHFWRETRDFRWIDVLGAMRLFRSEAVPQGSRLSQLRDGEIVVVPKARKPRPRAVRRSFQAGPVALAVRLAWLNRVLRPAVLVSGWSGSWSDLTARYDLTGFISMAHHAWSRSCGHKDHRGTPVTRASLNPYYEASRGEG